MTNLTKELAQNHKVIGKKVKILDFKAIHRSLETQYMERYVGEVATIVGTTDVGTGAESCFGKFNVRLADGSSRWFLGDLLEIKSKKLLAKVSQKIEVGTRVKLVNIDKKDGGTYHVCQSNTVGNTGVVTSLSSEKTTNIRVKWDNGSVNSYSSWNLKVIPKEEETIKAGDIVVGSSSRYLRTTDKAIMRVVALVGTSKARVKILFNSEFSCEGETFEVDVDVLKKLKKGVAFTSLVE